MTRLIGNLWRRWFGRCPAGPRHDWRTFQVRWRECCRRCGRIRDHVTGEEWPDWKAYVGSDGPPVLPRGGTGVTFSAEFGRAVAAVHPELRK